MSTEQFLYEIAKKYNKYDITIFYDNADSFQLKRLKKLVRCKKRIKGEIVKCKKAFFNFNLDMIDDVDAEEYIFVSHANYEELGYKPPIEHPKLTGFMAVSQFATDKLDEYGKKLGLNIKTRKCYNPLTLEPKEKVPILVSACRLDDKVKGGERTLKLIDALDRYCLEHNRHYLWLIFTNHTKFELPSKNCVYMKPRVDVRPYIAMADWLLQLSNDMETYCYSTNEANGYGVPIVTTPLSVYKELPVTNNERIVLNWDCSNVDEVARLIFEKEVKPFKYQIPKDDWEEILIKEESKYKEELEMRYLVEATAKYEQTNTSDNELSAKNNTRYVPKAGEKWEVDSERKEHLIELGFVKVIREIKPEKKEKIITEERKEEKTKKKTKKK